MEFIDLHGHYAWGIDDGIPTKEDAIKALEKAKENHISMIIATPHLVCGKHNQSDITNILERIDDLKKLASSYDIEVYTGSELFLNDEFYNQIQNNHVIPIANSHYMLCEFDVRKNNYSEDEFEDRLYEVRLKGYIPVIAHIERYFKEDIDLDRVRDLVDNGYVIQINSTSLLGNNGKTCMNNAYKLLENNLVHVISTDTHRSTGYRSPNLLETYQLLLKKFSKDDLNKLFYLNALSIIKDKEVMKTNYVKKSFFKKLFKKEN
jgi:protein-tyrosine phosphatase